MDPIEISTKYATTVPDLTAAWAFVMDHIDQVGPDPSIHIGPVWSYTMDQLDDENVPRHFEVAVSGTIRKDTHINQNQ